MIPERDGNRTKIRLILSVTNSIAETPDISQALLEFCSAGDCLGRELFEAVTLDHVLHDVIGHSGSNHQTGGGTVEGRPAAQSCNHFPDLGRVGPIDENDLIVVEQCKIEAFPRFVREFLQVRMRDGFQINRR
jgi:hypothetical protein